jgi:hypothetical protein
VLRAYRFRIEGGFVELSALTGCYGFYTTIYTRAGSARRGLDQAAQILKERMHKHGVAERSGAMFRTTYVVDDVSEVDAQACTEHEHKDLGFTFFRMNGVAALSNRFRYVLIRQFRSHLVMHVPSD